MDAVFAGGDVELERRIGELAATGCLSLLLDFDGTLAQIVADPKCARPDPSAIAALRALADRFPVAIVSGRGLADVSMLVGLDGISYFGSHGRTARFADGSVLEMPSSCQANLDELAGQLTKTAEKYPGAAVEIKPHAVVLHYRNLADVDEVGPLTDRAMALAERYPSLRMLSGRKVFEFIAADHAGKGQAVVDHARWVLATTDRRSRPAYFGDDTTDEDAFAQVRGEGLGVLISARRRPSMATFHLDGVEALAAVLSRLACQFGDHGHADCARPGS